METRQLVVFCEVVERGSFSVAAERLGVTQPAVSLQIRALERRLGSKLLDRSGRRVEPTEAGWRFYEGAQRLIALEDQLLEDVAHHGDGVVRGTLEIGCSTGPEIVIAVLLCDFQHEHPEVRVALSVFDTQRVVERIAARQLEFGFVGAPPRQRGVEFEPFFLDEVILVVPPEHPFADRMITLEELAEATLITMQEGAGVRQVIEDELRGRELRLRDLNVRLELGLQESVKAAVLAGHGVTFISRMSAASELEAGALAVAHVEGFEPSREISLVSSSGRSPTRAGQLFLDFARVRLAGGSAGQIRA
jgi:DNA-binding transcriptional LysR family regulator